MTWKFFVFSAVVGVVLAMVHVYPTTNPVKFIVLVLILNGAAWLLFGK